MKKLLLLTLAIVTLTSLFYCQNSPAKVKNGWEANNLKGKVKSETVSSYSAEDRFGEIQKKEGSLSSKYTNKFDDKGNIIESNYYKADGKLDFKVTNKFEFDEKGNWIKEISFKNQIPENIVERKYEYYE